jgi:hypothetical protein
MVHEEEWCGSTRILVVDYGQSVYRRLDRRLCHHRIYECRYDERLKTKSEKFTHLTFRGTGTPKDKDEVNRRDVRE